MKQIYEDLRKNIKTNNEMEQTVLEYIAWQLDTMKNQALAETTAKELKSGIFSIKAAVKAIKEAAVNGVCSDENGFRAVRRYLKIGGAVSDAEAALWFIRKLDRGTRADLVDLISSDDPVVPQALDLGLDDLFG